MANDPNKICDQAWGHIILSTHVDPGLYSRFDAHCLNNAVSPENYPPSKQCIWEQSGDKFILDNHGKKKELPEDKAVSCLMGLAAAEKWLEKNLAAVKLPDPPKPAGLADDATPTAAKIAEAKPAVAKPADAKPADAPKVVGLPAAPTPSVVAAPNDVTPVDAAQDPTATVVGLPADATPTSKVPDTGAVANTSGLLGWLGMVSGLVGSAPTQVGMSANNQEPLHLYRAPVYFGAAFGVLTPEIALWGTMLGRIQLDAVFEYIKFNPMQDQKYSREFHVVDLGPKISLQGIYPTSEDMRVFFGPYVGFLMGGLATDGAVEVAQGKGYDTAGKSSFITSLLYGLTVGAEQAPKDSQRVMGFAQLSAGVRQFFWGAKPDTSNFPATMQVDKIGFSGAVSIGVKFK